MSIIKQIYDFRGEAQSLLFKSNMPITSNTFNKLIDNFESSMENLRVSLHHRDFYNAELDAGFREAGVLLSALRGGENRAKEGEAADPI